MKVDSTKSDNQMPKEKQNKISKKAEQSVNLAFDKYINANTNQTKKDFASILKSTSEQNESRTENRLFEKTNENKPVDEEQKETKNDVKDKKDIREEKRERSNSDGNSDSDPNSDRSFGEVQIKQQLNVNEPTIPNGRVILHIADLERIISKIRSQTVANGKQVTIELKRSVFEGLKLKLTIGKDKSVTAEFLAANETVKSQLNARADELAELLKNRGVKLSKIQMSLDTDGKSYNKNDQSESEQIRNIKTSTKIDHSDKLNSLPIVDSDTSYQV